MHCSSTGEGLCSVSMTANAMQGGREACLAAAIDHCVSQPIRIDALVAAPLRVLARKKLTRELK